MSVYVEKFFGIFGLSSNRSSSPSTGNETAGSTTGGSVNQEPVVVWEAANSLEAQIIIGRLKSENIPAIAQGEVLGSIYGLTYGGLAETEVLVPAPLAEKAISLLEEEYLETDYTTDEDLSDKGTI